MPYIELVIKESLRITPPATDIFPRITQDNIMLGDVLIPRGTSLKIDIFSMHHHPDVWEEPDEFWPDRFANGEHSKIADGYMPFGSGTRICMGSKFTLFEQKVLLPMLRAYFLKFLAVIEFLARLIMRQAL